MNAANDALARGDLATAAAEFRKLAEQGDKNAQAHLGYMYYVGEGVEQDYARAVKWYKKA
ncbi:MAG: SEL1-like repeat protein, partial [Gammaproteobacteria bacterium]|nr:SEL1-like repeat protein [Gammaproteobacteria bacterium]